MFNQADKTYKQLPKILSLELALLSLDRIKEYLCNQSYRDFHIVLHGGEPTLWPLEYFAKYLEKVRHINQDGFNLTIYIQTNGVNLPKKLLDILFDHNVRIGISLDGPPIINDRFRVTHTGNGSYYRVIRTIDGLMGTKYQSMFTGFLCVSSGEINPAEFLAWINSLPLRNVDILWPMQYHYGNLPWNSGYVENYIQNPKIGIWFSELFMEWFKLDDPSLKIRLFEDCIKTIMGSVGHVDNIVNDKLNSFVINTDGGIEYHDYFRSYSDGACCTKYNITDSLLDHLLEDDGFQFCLNLQSHLPADCKNCEHVSLCGGGFLPGRLNPGEKWPNRRSVLCFDQYYFFSTIKQVVSSYINENGEINPRKSD